MVAYDKQDCRRNFSIYYIDFRECVVPPSLWALASLCGELVAIPSHIILMALCQSLRYLCVTIIGGLLEALSDQNDNLTLPLYMWSMLVAFQV
jgi:dolichol kinase